MGDVNFSHIPRVCLPTRQHISSSGESAGLQAAFYDMQRGTLFAFATKHADVSSLCDNFYTPCLSTPAEASCFRFSYWHFLSPALLQVDQRDIVHAWPGWLHQAEHLQLCVKASFGFLDVSKFGEQ